MSVLHSDENDVRHAGALAWAHVATTERLTRYAIHTRRGNETTRVMGALPRFRCVNVHDGCVAYRVHANCRHTLPRCVSKARPSWPPAKRFSSGSRSTPRLPEPLLEVSPMHKAPHIPLLVSALVLLAACGNAATAQPYTNMHTITAISAKVGAYYLETSPTIATVQALLSDGPTAEPMNIVALDGHFHKGTLMATHLSFSMLADGSKVWAILATDDQYSSTHTPVWLDDTIPITL